MGLNIYMGDICHINSKCIYQHIIDPSNYEVNTWFIAQFRHREEVPWYHSFTDQGCTIQLARISDHFSRQVKKGPQTYLNLHCNSPNVKQQKTSRNLGDAIAIVPRDREFGAVYARRITTLWSRQKTPSRPLRGLPFMTSACVLQGGGAWETIQSRVACVN